MFRSAAGDVIPARKTLAGRLLDDEGARVEENLENTLRGNYVVLALQEVQASSFRVL